MVVFYVGVPLLMFASVVDTSVLSLFRYLNGQPSLMLMLVVAWGLLNDLPEGLTWAVIGGIFADVLGVLPTGTSSFGYVLVVAVIASVFGQVGGGNLIVPPLAGVLATALYHGVVLGMLAIIGRPVPVGPAITTWVLPSMVFNGLGILVIFRIMGGVVEFFRPPIASL